MYVRSKIDLRAWNLFPLAKRCRDYTSACPYKVKKTWLRSLFLHGT